MNIKPTQILLIAAVVFIAWILIAWIHTELKISGSSSSGSGSRTGDSGSSSGTLECKLKNADGNEVTITCQKGDEACKKLCELKDTQREPYYILGYPYYPYYYSWWPWWNRTWWGFGGGARHGGHGGHGGGHGGGGHR